MESNIGPIWDPIGCMGSYLGPHMRSHTGYGSHMGSLMDPFPSMFTHALEWLSTRPGKIMQIWPLQLK